MIPLKALYTETPAQGLASDRNFPKLGPSHQGELMQQMHTQEEHERLSAHLQLSRDRRLGPTAAASSVGELTSSLRLSPLSGLSNTTAWTRSGGFNLRGSRVQDATPPKSHPSTNLRGSIKR